MMASPPPDQSKEGQGIRLPFFLKRKPGMVVAVEMRVNGLPLTQEVPEFKICQKHPDFRGNLQILED
jgi:hypothetical protein